MVSLLISPTDGEDWKEVNTLGAAVRLNRNLELQSIHGDP